MEYDYVIIGGGSAGCILARRLAEGQSGRVALIEAGGVDEQDPVFLDISRLMEQGPESDWGFAAAPIVGQPARMNYSRAKVLGGCGSHNDCAYLRPPPSDFLAWEAEGAVGWGPDTAARAFARLESRVTIESRPAHHPVSSAFLRAAEELGLDRKNWNSGIEVGVGMLTLNAKGRLRQSSSVAYLHPLSTLPRTLEVLTHTQVSRLLLREGRVVGCQTNRGVILANVEVILAAGSIQSAHLLMLSGIGEGNALRSLGIHPHADLPGVGANLMDHTSAAVQFRLAAPVPPWDVTPYEAVMLLKIDEQAPAPDVLCHFGLTVGGANGRHGEDSLAPQDHNRVDIAPNVARPKSRGSIRLISPDPNVAPRIDLNYLSDPDGHDERLLRSALRFARRFQETAAMRELGAIECSPGPSIQSDADWADHIRSRCETVYHAAGTCRIGAKGDARAVVDPRLNVFGVEGLRVVDASIFPTMVTVNINSTVMMAAERGAEMILEDRKRQRAAHQAPTPQITVVAPTQVTRSMEPAMSYYQDSHKPALGVVVDAYSTGRYLASAFAELGLRVIHVQSMRDILPFDRAAFQPHAFVKNIVAEGREQDVVEELRAWKPRFVVAGSESGVPLADYLAEALGLPGNGTQLSAARRDKHLMAEALRRRGVRAIRSVRTNSVTEACAWWRAQGLQEVVVKPVNSAGTEDVTFCRSDDDLQRAMNATLGKVNAMGLLNESVLVQERIRGQQYTVNTVSLSGQAYIGEIWTYETREIAGAGSVCQSESLISDDTTRAVIEPYVKDVLAALEIQHGPAHIELFVDADGPVLIELGARMQGSMSRSATLAALGHDHVSLTALCHADPARFQDTVSQNRPYQPVRHARIISLLSDRHGRVTGFSGLNQLRSLASFKDAISLPAIGDRMEPTRDLASTAGIIYLVHEDPEIVERDSQYVLALSIDRIIDLSVAA